MYKNGEVVVRSLVAIGGFNKPEVLSRNDYY